jgi:hypothetical protein
MNGMARIGIGVNMESVRPWTAEEEDFRDVLRVEVDEAVEEGAAVSLIRAAVALGLAASLAAGGAGRAEGADKAAWRWQQEDGILALAGPAGPLWQFRYGAGLDTAYFHPLNTADGRTLSADRPADHVWHHGLWFSWKFVDGVNYWEIDAKTGRPEGRTSWSNVRVEARDDHTARIAMDLAYRPAREEKPVLTEERTIVVHPPGADGAYAIDWQGAFRAVRKVVLDRTPIPGEPGAQPSFFSPAVLCYESMTLEAGQRLTLRDRVVVHEGQWDAVRLRSEHETYVRETKAANWEEPA